MDLRDYYKRLRELEATLPNRDVLVVSNKTPDGGREGIRTEVSREVAAKLITEARARLATRDEEADFRNSLMESRRQAEQLAAAEKIQLTVMSEGDMRALRSSVKVTKP